MQHLAPCLLLLQAAASSLLFFSQKDENSSGVASVCLPKARFWIENGKLVVEGRSSNLEVHHYGPEALHSQTDGVREGSLVVANPTSSECTAEQNDNMSGVIKYWRHLFHAGEVAFGDMTGKMRELDGSVDVYLVAKPGTNAIKYRLEKSPLEYPRLSGAGDLVSAYGLIDVSLEDPSLRWVGSILHAHSDLVNSWTSTLDRVFKLLGIVVYSVIAEKTLKNQGLEALRKLYKFSDVARQLLLAQENGASVQKIIECIVSSGHPLLEIVRILKPRKRVSHLRTLAIETLYYVEKALPGRVEMAHDAVELQGRVRKRSDRINWKDAKLPDPAVLSKIVSRLENPEYQDNVCTMLVCIKYSALVPGMKEMLLKESMEVCQKHQLQEAIPMLFMLSLGKWDWEKSGSFYRELKSCQSVEVMFQKVARFVTESREHECQRQNCWKLYCGRVPSPAPHFADLVLHAWSCGAVFERPHCHCRYCGFWDMSKDMVFCCIREALLRPMGLSFSFRRVLSHLSHRKLSAELASLGTYIDSTWHSQCALDDAVAEFVFRNGPPLMRQALAGCADEMKLGDRMVPELPNQAIPVELAMEVPERPRLNGNYYILYFGSDKFGAAEAAFRWMVENPDYSVLSRSSEDEAVCVLEDGVVAMSGHAFQDPNAAASLMHYAGSRTVRQLTQILGSQHSYISVQAGRRDGRIRVCRVVGDEWGSGWWTRSVVLRWSPGRGISLFLFSRNQDQTVHFSADETGPELFFVFQCDGCDPEDVLGKYRSGAGIVGTGTVCFDSDIVPIVCENEDLDWQASPSGVEVRLTKANRTNPVVRVLNEYCLNGVPYVLWDVRTWGQMDSMICELDWPLIAAFRVFSNQ